MRAEGVGLDDPAPVGVERGRALVTRANAVAPVVFVGEASAGPADVRYLDRLQRLDDVVADAARVRNLRIRTDPDPFVDATPEVLGKLAENVPVDLRAARRGVDD